jgi:hypothetical protein
VPEADEELVPEVDEDVVVVPEVDVAVVLPAVVLALEETVRPWKA